MIKKIKNILPAETIDMGGIPLKQTIPTNRVSQIDPFLLLHHAKMTFSDNRPARIQGIGPHPHRGFSPVTFVVKGEILHFDSFGNKQVAKEGEVQWMHAGAGIIHSERPTENLIQNLGKSLEIIQLWINSPASKKMIPPSYHFVPNEDIVYIKDEDLKIKTKLIAGSYSDKIGKIPTQSDLIVLWSEGEKEGVHKIDVPKAYNSSIYLIYGELRIEGYGLIEEETMVEFDSSSGNTISLEIKEDASYLILMGEPINEKITQQGPYVMNTQTEILEAMRDYQMGKMGVLIEE